MSRLLPIIATVIFFGMLAFFGVVELINYFRYPTLHQYAAPSGGWLTLYDKGMRYRAADVFLEPHARAGTPQFVATFFYAGRDRDGRVRPGADSLWWTAYGTGLAATIPEDDFVPPGGVRWFYDLTTQRFYGGYDDPAATTVEEGALIDELIRAQGGLGSRIVAGYELGRKVGYLPTWKTTRWENTTR